MAEESVKVGSSGSGQSYAALGSMKLRRANAVAGAVAQAHATAWCLHRSPHTRDPQELGAAPAHALSGLDDLSDYECHPAAPRTRAGRQERLQEVLGRLYVRRDEASEYLFSVACLFESLPVVWWSFLRSREDTQQVLATAASGRHEADTVVAVAGNRVGAYLGYDPLPERWRRDLEFSNGLRAVADALLVGGDR